MSHEPQNARPLRVLLLRADPTSPNLGVRVLAEGMTALSRRAWGADTVVHVQNYDGGDTGVSFNKAAVVRDALRLGRGPIGATFRRYDVVADVGGGDSFTDIYGLRRLGLLLYTQAASQRAGVPTILAPQTIGPFTRWIPRTLAARSMKRMALVLARDNASEQEAAQLGRPADLSATDVVFALPVPAVARTRDVVVNPSGLLWRDNHHVDASKYRDSVRGLVARLLADGRAVSLMPHVLDSASADNDWPVVTELASEFPDAVVERPTSIADVRDIAASANLLIGARMHACLNAISVGTPALPWAYSRKFAPLLGDIGWDHVVDLRTEADPVSATYEILERVGDPSLKNEAGAVRARAEARLEEVVRALRGVTQSSHS
ncbi:polysaccharide pyruvyl transferase family protein [Pseudoclavibacter helvolus]|uniref:polysaccharide pyruvyl transferase family protein n=1 Tax=Pseudoclavibacter helvolus TaxID=255205 RepID=UPI003C7777EB